MLLGEGFWRWKFRLIEDPQFNTGWQMMLHNMIRWIVTGSYYENIIISSKQKSYQIGETVNLDIEVYDGSYNPIPEALVRLKISSKEDTFEVESENSGNGVYKAKFVPLKHGDYHIWATAWKNDINLGEASFEINATPVNNEFLYTKQDYQFLNKLATKTGGIYFSEDTYEQIVNSLDLSPQIIQTRKTIELWNRMLILIFIILLLSIEWYFRKRKGLA